MARRRSSIRNLPDELRKEVDRLLGDGRYTIVQVTEHLRELGADVSRSAVHRYSQSFEEVTHEMRLVREMSAALGKELEDVADGDGTRLLVESLQALILRSRMELAKGDKLDPEAVSYLSRSLKDLGSAMKSSVDVEMKIRDRVAKEAAKVASATATEKGLSAETVNLIKERILGIAKRS